LTEIEEEVKEVIENTGPAPLIQGSKLMTKEDA